MSWDNVTNVPPTFTNSAELNKMFLGNVDLSTYQSFGGTTTVVRATVTVTWTNRHSRVVTNTLTTLIGNQGINKTSL